MKKFIKSLKILCVWILLFIILGESGLRFFSWANRRWHIIPKTQRALGTALMDPAALKLIRKYSPTLAYRNTPNYKTRRIQINAQGFRGAEFDPVKSSGTLRVITMGDSCTFGWEVDNKETYPQLLEDKTKKLSLPLPLSVINAGVPGYSSWQALSWLKEELLELDPDIVTIYLGWNDLFDARPESGKRRGKNQAKLSYLLHQSYLITEIHLAAYNILEKLKRISPLEETALYRNYEPNFFNHQMRDIVNVLKSKNIRPILFTLPTSHESGKESTHPFIFRNPEKFEILYNRYNQAIRNLAKNLDVELLDLADQMNGKKNLFTDFCHPSAKGNRFISDAIIKFLKRAHNKSAVSSS